jgi:hypothetical protein
MELEFCQHCGGHTLVRVSISINAAGNVQLKQSNRQVFWKRGTVVRIHFLALEPPSRVFRTRSRSLGFLAL